MRTVTDVEQFLNNSAVRFQDFGDGLFIVTDEGTGLHNLAIKVEDDVVVFQLRVMPVPPTGTAGREDLYERLLRLNGEGLLHAAFAVQGDGIFLQAALPLPNLDPNEMQAVLDDIGIAVSQHLPRLQHNTTAN
jgi:hypothetical protein